MAGDAGEFFDDEGIKRQVEQLWAEVFASSNKVLNQAKRYGFTGIEVIPSPNIHDMLITLQLVSAVIEVLLTHAGVGNLEYTQQRQLLNAKQQITTMEQLAAALIAKSRGDYEKAVKALADQAVF